MLPWNYGFQWNLSHIIFLGAFYCVLAAIAATLIAAARRSRRAQRENKVEEIAWHADFHDLPARDRVCRHVLSGELQGRECPHAFDCRHCETHAKLIRQHPLPPADQAEEDLFGMAFPLDRFYHRGHTWAHPESDGTVTVGLDELGSRLLGTPDAVELPQPGAHVEANGTAFRVHKRDADVRVLSPASGIVVETGGADRGWYLKIRPAAAGEQAFRHLLRGAEVRPWLMREMERLQMALATPHGAPTLADGGEPVADIAASYPHVDWDAVCGEMFSSRNSAIIEAKPAGVSGSSAELHRLAKGNNRRALVMLLGELVLERSVARTRIPPQRGLADTMADHGLIAMLYFARFGKLNRQRLVEEMAVIIAIVQMRATGK